MKSLSLFLVPLTLLSLLAACGKDNESGKKSTYQMGSSPYGTFQTSQYQSFGNVSVNEIISRNPCMTSGAPNQNRTQNQIPLTGFQTVLPVNDIYVGVTSSGDVAVLVGQGNGQPPMFVTYLCQRGYTMTGQGQITDLAFGSYSRCNFKPITRATMVLPGAPVPLHFRWLDGGTSLRQPFGPPVCL